MTINEQILDTCKGIVEYTDSPIFILSIMGEHRIYLGRPFRLPSKDVPWGDVTDMKDITRIVAGMGGMTFPNGINERSFAERIQSIPLESFYFSGNQEFIFLHNVKENR